MLQEGLNISKGVLVAGQQCLAKGLFDWLGFADDAIGLKLYSALVVLEQSNLPKTLLGLRNRFDTQTLNHYETRGDSIRKFTSCSSKLIALRILAVLGRAWRHDPNKFCMAIVGKAFTHASTSLRSRTYKHDLFAIVRLWFEFSIQRQVDQKVITGLEFTDRKSTCGA